MLKVKYNEFGEVNEQSILDNCPKVIGDIKREFGLILDSKTDNLGNSETFSEQDPSFNEQNSRGYARVLTMDGAPIRKTEKFYDNDKPFNMGGYSIDGDIKKTNGASYVVIVAAIIALIAIVYIITTTILGMMDGLV